MVLCSLVWDLELMVIKGLMNTGLEELTSGQMSNLRMINLDIHLELLLVVILMKERQTNSELCLVDGEEERESIQDIMMEQINYDWK